MNARATTTVAVLRGTTIDDYGDEVDTTQPVRTGIPASLIEQRRRPYPPVEGALRTVRYATCRVSANVDIRKHDRIRDERTGQIYLVDELHNQASPVNMPDLVFDCSFTN